MSEYINKAKEVRASAERHYNCAQATVVPFSEAAGVDEETAMRFASGFGGGMKSGSVCGAVTGGVMALGLFGLDDRETLGRYFRALKEAHGPCLECRELLKKNAEAGGEKKTHCDGMVFECVGLAEGLIEASSK